MTRPSLPQPAASTQPLKAASPQPLQAASPQPPQPGADPAPGCPEADALAHERALLDALRAGDPAARAANPDAWPVGLALSGGGIRSATVSLGVLQALAEARLLRHVDYLSTVSGGGYIGCWFSAIVQGRHRAGDADPIGSAESLLWPGPAEQPAREAAEIGFLRAYSNYLTPRLGLFSGDTLAALTGYLRNLCLSLLLAICSIALVLSLLHLLVAGWDALHRLGPQGLQALSWASQALLLLAAAAAAMLLTLQSLDPRAHLPDDLRVRPLLQALQLMHAGVARALLPVVALGLSCAGLVFELGRSAPGGWVPGLPDMLPFCAAMLAAMAGGALLAHLLLEMAQELAGSWDRLFQVQFWWTPLVEAIGWQYRAVDLLVRNWRETLRYPLAVLVCALVAAGLLAWSAQLGPAPAPLALFRGPVLAMGLAAALAVVWLGAVGTLYAEPTREWLSRLLGSLLGVALAWAAAGLLVNAARPLLSWLLRGGWLGGGGWLVAAQAAWIVPTAGLLLVATLLLRRQQPADAHQAAGAPAWLRLAVVLGCAGVTLLFLAGMTAGLQQALLALVGRTGQSAATLPALVALHQAQLADALRLPPALPAWPGLPAGLLDAQAWAAGTGWPAAVGWLQAWVGLVPALSLALGAALATWLAFRTIDVNVFSLQNLYRNRLVRCYLGAARQADRLPSPYAGFDPADDLPLADLAAQRPLHIVNAALNITHGDDLALQQRKAASFSFTPLWCGYWMASGRSSDGAPQGGYVPTAAYGSEPASGGPSRGVMLGTAMATSGAAVSPQMGFASSGLLAFVLTLFNVRLGRWLPNTTARQAGRGLLERHSPASAGSWYLKELLGRTNEKSDWVYLSDGGHFDNLGVYELVRRRCRLIVAVDAGADPAMGFGDLGNAVRKCRVDFGVDIRIDLQAFGHDPAVRRTRVAHVQGTVHYPAAGDAPACVGTILYLKASLPMVGAQVPADILSFLAENRQFPHQPTADQWFTESQFESYRLLGQWLMRMAVPDVRQGLADVARGRC